MWKLNVTMLHIQYYMNYLTFPYLFKPFLAFALNITTYWCAFAYTKKIMKIICVYSN